MNENGVPSASETDDETPRTENAEAGGIEPEGAEPGDTAAAGSGLPENAGDAENENVEVEGVEGEDVKVEDVEVEDAPPATPEPADTEPADTETADIETADIETADIETADIEGAGAEPGGGAEDVSADAGRAEPTSTAAADAEPADTGTADAEAAPASSPSESPSETVAARTVPSETIPPEAAPSESAPSESASETTRSEAILPDDDTPAAEPDKAGDTAALPADAATAAAAAAAATPAAASGSPATPTPPTPPAPPAAKTGGGGKSSNGKGKGKVKKERSRPARYARRALFVLLGFIGFCVVGFGVAYLFTPVPSPQEEAVAQGPTFYYADGKTVIAKTGVNRDAVPIKQIPEGVREAVIAAENKSFYEDPGVSVRGTMRAFWSTATGEQLQGGSTITQQMVRNYYGGIGKERSVTRKLKEIMVSLKVGREKPKDWILEQYLNTIYFGRDAYGVQAAARAYYGQDVSQLTPAQGAYLAAAIQQPSNFAEPSSDNRAYVEQRWRSVVGNMVENGAITQAEASKMAFPLPAKQKITDVLKGQKGYMVNVAKKELIERRGYSEDEINRSGLKITTTFDKRLMDAAKEAVTSSVPAGMSKKIRTGMVSVDPKSGEVVAFYGGRDYLKEALSSTFGDWAQAGSGFKPIVLAAALDDGMKLYDTVDGSSPQYYNGARVPNDGGRSYGYVNLVGATQNSVNTAYVNIGQKIGLDKVSAMAEKLGYTKKQLTANGANTAVTFPLGVVSAHPIQQAGVYATFASEGIYHEPYVVKQVTDGEDHTRKFSEKGERVFSPQVARDASYAMSQVVRAGTGTGAQLPDGRDVAGKTGTTDEGRAIWFNGFIPQMATTVAMFRSDGKPLNIPGYGSYGGQLPAQMWRGFMSQAVNIENLSPESFGSPSSTPGGYAGRQPGQTGDATPTRPGPQRPPDSDRPETPSDPPPGDGPDEPEIPLPPDPDDPGPGDPGGGGGDDDPPGNGGGGNGGGGGGGNG
ncbi:transglycosylase domain-containing protein [Spirillospora sp. NPDC029432]|uniref:transglycosylase domain-containing protein n=1 Tax=Spirillospora sp. NPDC029432 TaxID=3154599 RepID=UPI003451CE31